MSNQAFAEERSDDSEKDVTRIAFGSCNKQYEEQPVWDVLTRDFAPQVWLWAGDAVYNSEEGSVEALREAYEKQSEVEAYQRFLETGVIVDGVYDDHDMGVNDAGKELGDKVERQSLFLDFLGAPETDPRRERLRRPDGSNKSALYHTRTLGTGPKQIKIIFLDVRTERDLFYLSFLSSPWFARLPFSARVGALARAVSTAFCLGSDYDGDMLGEEQWAFLEEELSDSPAAAHILVSTVQVLTTVTVQESWGYFPRSKQRLLHLLNQTKPRGLAVISGDVHFAELNHGVAIADCPSLGVGGGEGGSEEGHQQAEALGVLEITTSGLTHSAREYGERTVSKVLRYWSVHRAPSWGQGGYSLGRWIAKRQGEMRQQQQQQQQQQLVVQQEQQGQKQGQQLVAQKQKQQQGRGLGWVGWDEVAEDVWSAAASASTSQRAEGGGGGGGGDGGERAMHGIGALLQALLGAGAGAGEGDGDGDGDGEGGGDGGSDPDPRSGFFLGRNFGFLEIDWAASPSAESGGGGGGATAAAAQGGEEVGCELCPGGDGPPVCRGELVYSVRAVGSGGRAAAGGGGGGRGGGSHLPPGTPVLGFTRSTCDRMETHLEALDMCSTPVIPSGCAVERLGLATGVVGLLVILVGVLVGVVGRRVARSLGARVVCGVTCCWCWMSCLWTWGMGGASVTAAPAATTSTTTKQQQQQQEQQYRRSEAGDGVTNRSVCLSPNPRSTTSLPHNSVAVEVGQPVGSKKAL